MNDPNDPYSPYPGPGRPPPGRYPPYEARRRSFFPIALLVLVAFLAGVLWDRYGWLPGRSGREPAQVARLFAPYWEAWRLVHQRYVDPKAVNDEHMMQMSITGMLASLGDVGHTTYLTREELERLQSGLKGELEGIGARITVRDRRPTIMQAMPGSPAQKAGLKAGDVILKVDGEPVDGLSLQQLVNKVRGPAGTAVHLEVQRQGQGQPLEVEITRAKVDVPDVTWRMLPGTPVAHLALQEFGVKADDELRAALKELRGQGAKGALLDVRGNPGGLKEQAVAVTSEFLKAGDVVFIQVDAEGGREKVMAKPGGVAPDFPVVVLTDEGTASSAEIFAGALKDYGRAKLVGARTFGTGTVLEPFRLSDGSAVLLAVAKWLTPKGHEIWHQGIAPDYEVPLARDATIVMPWSEEEQSAEAFAKIKDKQLLKAVEVLKEQLK
jgi:carboxyl-terminal processing protease